MSAEPPAPQLFPVQSPRQPTLPVGPFGGQVGSHHVVQCVATLLHAAPLVKKETGQGFWPWPASSRWSCRESNPTLYQGFCRLICWFRCVSLPFSPDRYLRFRSRVLTASRAVTYGTDLMGSLQTSPRCGGGGSEPSNRTAEELLDERATLTGCWMPVASMIG